MQAALEIFDDVFQEQAHDNSPFFKKLGISVVEKVNSLFHNISKATQ